MASGRFEIERDGEVACLEYSLSPSVLGLLHTEVPENFREQVWLQSWRPQWEEAKELLNAPDLSTVGGCGTGPFLPSFWLAPCAAASRLRSSCLISRCAVRWVFADLLGKGKRPSTVPVLLWVKRVLSD